MATNTNSAPYKAFSSRVGPSHHFPQSKHSFDRYPVKAPRRRRRHFGVKPTTANLAFDYSNCGPDLPEDPLIKIAVIGHSFVNRFDEKMYYAAHDIGVSLQELMNLRGSRIVPYLYGRPGGKIRHIPMYDLKTDEEFPHVVVIDTAQNDLCETRYTPKELAFNMKEQADLLLGVNSKIELIVVCHVTPKTDITRSPKSLKQFNKDVIEYNYQLLRATRASHKILRWRHKGMIDPVKPVTGDGTHPDTPEGEWKYEKSIAAVCRWAKAELLIRRTHSKWALKKKVKRDKQKLRAERLEKRQNKLSTK